MEGDRSSDSSSSSSSSSSTSSSLVEEDTKKNNHERVTNITSGPETPVMASGGAASLPIQQDDQSGVDHHHQQRGTVKKSRARRPVKFRITKEERQDFIQSLEHIVATGSHAYERDWRIKEWKRMQKEIQQEQMNITSTTIAHNDDASAGDADNVVAAAAAAVTASDLGELNHSSPLNSYGLTGVSRLLHAQDRRIYPRDSKETTAVNIWNWPTIEKPRSNRAATTTNTNNAFLGHKRKFDSNDKYDNDVDREWDKEVGDGIDVVNFTDSQLSFNDTSLLRATNSNTDNNELLSPCAQKLKSNVKITKLLPKPKVHPTVLQSDVPNAMLMRCWERAVHAASNSIITQYSAKEGENQEGAEARRLDLSGSHSDETNKEKSPGQLHKQEQDRKVPSPFTSTYAAAVHKCSALQISLEFDEEGPLTCPACQCEFDSSEKLKIHFYGEKQLRGCCWKVIHAKQQQLVQDVLDKEVNETANGLIDILFSCASDALEEKKTKTDSGNPGNGAGDAKDHRRKKLNWQDVLHCFDFSIKSATSMVKTPIEPFKHEDEEDGDEENTSSPNNSRNPILDTLKFDPSRNPIILNKDVLESASRRLIERYADIPF